MSEDTITREDILQLIKAVKEADPPKLSEEELNILKEVVKDRQAMGRAWSWLLYALGGVSTAIVSYGVITGSFLEWVKNHIAR